MKVREKHKINPSLYLLELNKGDTFRLANGAKVLVKSDEYQRGPDECRCVYLESGSYQVFKLDRVVVRVEGEFVYEEVPPN